MTTLAEALGGGNPRIGVFFRLAIDPPFRLWLGIGDVAAGLDAEDGAGESYQGFGQMLNVPQFTQLINGVAERVTFQLSAIPERVAQLAGEGSDEVKGVALNVGLGVFDAEWQLVASPFWLKRFTVDFLTLKRDQPADGEPVYAVELSARSAFSGRRRPGLTYFTDEEQQRRSPGDRFCEHVRRYAPDEDKAWPRGD
jgi:hypothetical protein